MAAPGRDAVAYANVGALPAPVLEAKKPNESDPGYILPQAIYPDHPTASMTSLPTRAGA